MAMYRCGECGELVDDDYSPGADVKGELVCESCVCELEENAPEMPARKFKETIFQPADDGIPRHWAVQYYTDGSSFPDTEYFDNLEDAVEFEEELKGA